MPNTILNAYSALDYAHTGMCVIDSDYNVLFWNKRLVEWTSIAKDHITSKNITIYCPALSEKRNSIRLNEIFKGGPPVIFSSQIHKHLFPAPLSNGGFRIQHVTVSAIPSQEPKKYYALFAVEDVTELTLRMNELDKAKHEAETANRSKSDFLANMSHEIRTPMNGVLGMCNILLNSGLTEDQTNYAHMIDRSGKALLSLINDILDFSKIEAGKMTLSPSPFDLKRTQEDVIQMLSFAAEKKGLRLLYEYQDSASKYFIADEGRVRQILINIVNNAIKFTEQGSVSLLVCSYPGEDPYELVKISVKDTGIGITENAQQLLFNKFIQVDSSSTRKFQGTGLGLAISRQLARLMGGDITLQSQPGSGSDFTIALNLLKANQDQIREINSKNIEISSESDFESFNAHILLAEDNQINQAVACHILESLHCKVEIVENGQEAIDILQKETFDLIFMDCQMPVLDGYSATRLIRNLEKNGTQHIPIVAMTAHAIEGDRKKCLNSGMDDYISKPLIHQELIRILDKYCAGLKQNQAASFQPSILIADDEIVTLRELEKAVTNLFPKSIVKKATDGVEACMLLGNFRPDLFLCDILIPNMDGEAVISYMKRSSQFEKTRIIVITALSGNDPTVNRIRRMGVAGILFKPIEINKFNELLLSAVHSTNPEPVFDLDDPILPTDFLIDYRGLVESSLQGIGIFQNNGFIFSNAALSKIFNKTVDSILHADFSALQSCIHKDDAVKFEKLLQINFSVPKSPEREIIRFHSGHHEMLIIDMYSCLIQHKNNNARLLLCTDISDWMLNTNNGFLNSVLFHEKHFEWSEYVSSLSNEIRNPLTTILGATRIINSEPINKKQVNQLALIEESALHLTSILEDFQNHSMGLPQTGSVNNLSFDLSTTIQEVIKVVSPRIFSHNLEFIVNQDDFLCSKFTGEPARIRQLLTYLLNFIMEEIPESYILLNISQKENSATDIIDTTFTVSYSKSMLKLATTNTVAPSCQRPRCSNLDFAQSVAATLESEINFDIIDNKYQYSFSIQLHPQRPGNEVEIDITNLIGESILFTENTKCNSDVLHEQLRQTGVTIECTGTPESIYEIVLSSCLGEKPFSIVIFDYSDNYQSAIDTAKKIKSDPVTAAVSLVLLTNKAQPGEAVIIEKAGFEGYLVKPVFPMELEKICSVIIQRRKSDLKNNLVTRYTVLEAAPVPSSNITGPLNVLVYITLPALCSSIISKLRATGCAAFELGSTDDIHNYTDKNIDLIFIDESDFHQNTAILTTLSSIKNAENSPAPIAALVYKMSLLPSMFNASNHFHVFLEKPILKNDLIPLITSLSSIPEKTPKRIENAKLTLHDIPQTIVNVTDLLERLGEDEPFATELLIKFSESLPSELTALEKALHKNDFSKIELTAHRIKGAARNLSICGLMETMDVIEHAGRALNIETISDVFSEAKSHSDAFIATIGKLAFSQ
jgi:signal transduction histidine kinase/DNA-binding response OmpR family regulator/HPt (histidine-containing phosphotransfer) domain-containing protein